MLAKTWCAFAKLATDVGLGARLHVVPEDPKTPTYGKKVKRSDPSEEALALLLPSDYRAFVSEVGYVSVDLGEGARLAFLPPRVMRQVTGAMGDGRMSFDAARTLREKGTYAWPFAFFAGSDLADVTGFCFARGKTGALAVFRVEESLASEKPVGEFGPWLTKEVARLAKKIESAEKAARCLRRLREEEGLEAHEKLPPVMLDSFGA